MLREILKELKDDQIGYRGVHSIYELQAIDISEKNGRFELILEILKMGTHFKHKIYSESKQLADPIKVKHELAACLSYSANHVIVGGKLKQIAESLSFEIIKENKGKFDYTLIKEIVKGKVSPSDFLSEIKDKTGLNSLYSLTGKDGKVYSGKGLSDAAKYKTDEALSILEGYAGDNARIKAGIEYILGSEKKELNSKFKSTRAACMSVISEMIGGDKKSKVIDHAIHSK